MSTWMYLTKDRHLVVDDDSWFDALPGALSDLGMDAEDFTPLHADVVGDDTVVIQDLSGTFSMVVRPATPAPEPTPVDYQLLDASPAPAQVGMVPESLWDLVDREIDALAEHEVPAEQADEVLRILMEACNVESGSVMTAAPDAEEFAWLAARGPKAREVMRHVVHTDEGIASAVLRRQAPFMVHDAQKSMRHLHHLDTATGYRPRAVLAVPLTSHDGARLGVVELLDADRSFEPWVPKLAAHVAHRLADLIAVRWQVAR